MYVPIGHFFNKFSDVKTLNYWEKLKTLKMLSQERRMERYRILYVWKILDKKALNCGIESYESERRGRLCKIPELKLQSRKAVQSLRENSFQVHGPALFNILPKRIRSLKNCSVNDFKAHLDSFLETIPDEPKISNLTPRAINPYTAKSSNSLLYQVQLTEQTTGG